MGRRTAKPDERFADIGVVIETTPPQLILPWTMVGMNRYGVEWDNELGMNMGLLKYAPVTARELGVQYRGYVSAKAFGLDLELHGNDPKQLWTMLCHCIVAVRDQLRQPTDAGPAV
jgi:hypothetical protein